MSLKPPYNRPYIDLLLEEYFPKESYNDRIRKKAKQMALDFHKEISGQKAMNDAINTKLFFGETEMTEKTVSYKGMDFKMKEIKGFSHE